VVLWLGVVVSSHHQVKLVDKSVTQSASGKSISIIMIKLYIVTFAVVCVLSVDAAKDPKNPFAYTCIDSKKYQDIALNSEFTCADDTSCLCSHFQLKGSSWNCISGENPCGSSPKIPRYPTSSFQATILGSVDDGSAIMNISSQWIYDGANRRERMDSIVWERSPEPNRFFSSRTVHMVTTGEMVFEVTADSMDMHDAKCRGFPLPPLFTGTAAFGSINRFLPRDDRLYASHDDKFIGSEEVVTANGNKVKCDVWGWTEHDSETLKEAGFHKVYVSSEDGWPIREVEVLYIENSDPVIVDVEFQFDRRVSHVSGGWYLGNEAEANIFEVPRDCIVPRPKRTEHSDL
jgi:hypothetical protein